jgi:hypothetical protein
MNNKKDILIFETEYSTKIKCEDSNESLARLKRVIFLRSAKEELRKIGKWTEFCKKNSINQEKADDEIDKLGDFKDEALGKFSSHVGYEINKIKWLSQVDWEKSPVRVDDQGITLDGKLIPYQPENAPEIQAILDQIITSQKKQAKEIKRLQKEADASKDKLSAIEEENKTLRLKEEDPLAFYRKDWKMGLKSIDAGIKRLTDLFIGDAADRDPEVRKEFEKEIKKLKGQFAGCIGSLISKLDIRSIE